MYKNNGKIAQLDIYNNRYKEFDIGNRSYKYLRKENLNNVGIGEGGRESV